MMFLDYFMVRILKDLSLVLVYLIPVALRLLNPLNLLLSYYLRVIYLALFFKLLNYIIICLVVLNRKALFSLVRFLVEKFKPTLIYMAS
jgi:hypothetical protein